MNKTKELSLTNRLGSKHERTLKEIRKVICNESLFYDEVKVTELQRSDEKDGPLYKVEGEPFVDDTVIEKISKILEELTVSSFRVGFEFGQDKQEDKNMIKGKPVTITEDDIKSYNVVKDILDKVFQNNSNVITIDSEEEQGGESNG